MAKRKMGTGELPFGRILKKIMDERGLTVRAVAEMAGVSSSVVQSWVGNKAIPHDLHAVSKLAKSLNLGFKGLLLGEPETNQHPATAAEVFEEQDFFEGICKISIKRLNPRRAK